jgi:hypothetical protein
LTSSTVYRFIFWYSAFGRQCLSNDGQMFTFNNHVTQCWITKKTWSVDTGYSKKDVLATLKFGLFRFCFRQGHCNCKGKTPIKQQQHQEQFRQQGKIKQTNKRQHELLQKSVTCLLWKVDMSILCSLKTEILLKEALNTITLP